MISNQVLQNTLEGLKEISRTEFCVLDTEGKVLASTFADFSIATQDVQAFVESQADSQLVKGFQYFKVCDDYQLEYILVAHGDDEDTYMVGKLAAFQIQNLIVAYKERFDKEQLIQKLVEFKGLPQELELPSAPKQFIQYLEEDNRPQVQMDVNYENGMGVSVGRLREDTVYDYKFIGLSHNTVRGAAGGAVLCAETLKAKGYIQAK